MELINIAGFAGFMAIGLGILLIGRDNHWGLFCQMLGSIIWFCNGWFMEDGAFAIIFWNAIFAFTCGYSFLRLHRKRGGRLSWVRDCVRCMNRGWLEDDMSRPGAQSIWQYCKCRHGKLLKKKHQRISQGDF